MRAAEHDVRAVASRIVATAMAATPAPGNSILFGPNNKPLPIRPTMPENGISRAGARRSGSMKNWIPRRLTSRQQETMEREELCRRSSDLVANDPHAAGLNETFAITVIGSGLMPHFSLDADEVGLDKEQARTVKKQMLRNLRDWWMIADAGARMNFGQIQYLIKRNLFQYGEYLVLLPMLDDPLRPFSLACQVIHPMRLKTPVDKINDPNIRDGVELGPYGEPIAYWIKKSAVGSSIAISESSANFVRVERKAGHRIKVLHGFIQREPEQVRGVVELAPAMKMSRDFNDLIDAELVSNIVTAAVAYFIETTGGNPYENAIGRSSFETTDQYGDSQRYEEFEPGQIMYGNQGEKPHFMAANRPGTTFEPFTKLIKKSMALAVGGLPYPVAFKDVDGVSFAGFRSAMLEAWRIFMTHRQWMGDDVCQPINVMLQEEAWLRNRLDVPDFYGFSTAITAAKWRGAPKGDIEPYKAAMTDVMEIKNNLKTHEEARAERGGSDFRSSAETLHEEWELVENLNLPDARKEINQVAAPAGGNSDPGLEDPDNPQGDKND